MPICPCAVSLLALVWSFIVIGVHAIVLAPMRKAFGVLSCVGLPCCYMSTSEAAVAKLRADQKQRHAATKAPPRIAVIGGGIAGSGAAWTLAKAVGAEGSAPTFSAVHLYEQRSSLGGNAKTHLWEVAKGEDGVPTVVKNGSTTSQEVVDTVRTGLSVLAWPPMYFKTYESLLKALHIRTERVTPKFFVATEGEEGDAAVPQFRQGATFHNSKWAVDMSRWDRAVGAIRAINGYCSMVDALIVAVLKAVLVRPIAFLLMRGASGANVPVPPRRPSAEGASSPAPSFYEVCLWNPLNIITARFFVCRICGVSQEFWTTVVVPIYSSSFLTTKLDALPAMILPALDDIISVGSADPLKTLHTWHEGSNTVFGAMQRDILRTTTDAADDANGNAATSSPPSPPPANANAIILNARISAVEWSAAEGLWTITYTLAEGAAAGGAAGDGGRSRRSETPSVMRPPPPREYRQRYEYVIFACPSEAINTFTNTPINKDSHYRNSLFKALVPNITYENERDDNFTVGHIHCDEGGLPQGRSGAMGRTLAEELLAERYTNYVEVAAGDGTQRKRQSPSSVKRYGPVATSDAVENVFILSTWVPQAVAAGARHFGAGSIAGPNAANVFKMMVSYNPAPSRRALFGLAGDKAADGSGYVKRKHTITGGTFCGGGSSALPLSAAESRKFVRFETDTKVTLTSAPAGAVSPRPAAAAVGANSSSATIALVDNTWAHPQLDLPNMLRSQALTMLQGHCNSYYCGNYATPGNGHDLSLLSGIVIADEVLRAAKGARAGGNGSDGCASAAIGASYPFAADVAVAGAKEDFYRLRGLMLRSL